MNVVYQLAHWASRLVGSDSLVARAGRPLIEPVIRWSTGHRGLAWHINGVPCRIDPRRRAQFAANYDSVLAKMLSTQVRPGQTCLDVGANIGVWVLQFAHWVGPSGRVFAFEPNLGAREVLQEHITMNGLDQVAHVVPAAVGASPGEVTFFAAGRHEPHRLA